ncbi:MAG: ADP-ribosylglycohydrolase family protein [Chloroflexota bacterium]|nr:ADP-ribosylglycohydrolase family protein [Chloroflexota bacterium]
MTTRTPEPLLALAEPTQEHELGGRAVAAVVGGAIADAMGWITEFMRGPDSLERFTGRRRLEGYVAWDKRTGGRFNTYIDHIDEGSYSDDTQLSLCTARSIEPDGSFNAQYFAKVELPLWTQYARGAGAAVTAAARGAARKRTTWNSNFFTYTLRRRRTDYRDAGSNGAAMRSAPLAIANHGDPERLSTAVWRSAVVTHGHPRAIVGALLIAEALRRVLTQETVEQHAFLPDLLDFVVDIRPPDNEEFDDWLRRWNQDGRDFGEELQAATDEAVDALGVAADSRHEDISGVLRRLGCYDPASKGSGIATVAAALALFYRWGGNFKACVEQAVNAIGTDTDTIGAMAAGLTAAHAGMSELPEAWTVQLQDYEYLNRTGEALAAIGNRTAIGWDLAPAIELPEQAPAERQWQSIDFERAGLLSARQRIVHPLFGRGWIRNVQTQEIRRKRGGTITLIDVAFDMGQSIRLRTRQGLLFTDAHQIAIARAREYNSPEDIASEGRLRL